MLYKSERRVKRLRWSRRLVMYDVVGVGSVMPKPTPLSEIRGYLELDSCFAP